MKTIGIDIGGTKIQGLSLENGKVLKKINLPLPENSKELINSINSIKKKVDPDNKIDKIGIGVPGSIERKTGRIFMSPNISFLKNYPLKKELEKHMKAKIKIENDVNCIALAESIYGLGKSKKNLIIVAIGTGIGGGLILNKKLYIGKSNAGEFGHIPIYPDGKKCSCGSQGCLEEYAGGKVIKDLVKNTSLSNKTPKEIEILAREKNKEAISIYESIGKMLGIGLSSIILILDPEIIILSGSLSNASDLFLPTLKKELKKRVYFQIPNIKISKMKDKTAIGAALLFDKNILTN